MRAKQQSISSGYAQGAVFLEALPFFSCAPGLHVPGSQAKAISIHAQQQLASAPPGRSTPKGNPLSACRGKAAASGFWGQKNKPKAVSLVFLLLFRATNKIRLYTRRSAPEQPHLARTSIFIHDATSRFVRQILLLNTEPRSRVAVQACDKVRAQPQTQTIAARESKPQTIHCSL